MSNKYSDYKLTPAAKRDLEVIWRYTAETWSLDQADIYITEITDALEGLVTGRKVGRPVNHIRENYLGLLFGSHIAYFKIEETSVIVVRILHQRMQVPNRIS